MPNNDYFKIVYQILCYLYDIKKEGRVLKVDEINHEAFGIS